MATSLHFAEDGDKLVLCLSQATRRLNEETFNQPGTIGRITKGDVMSECSRPYEAGFYRRLQDDTNVIYYLQAAAEDSQDAFLMALGNVAQARHVPAICKASELQRIDLYQMLSRDGVPTVRGLAKVLDDFGVKLVLRTECFTALMDREQEGISKVA